METNLSLEFLFFFQQLALAGVDGADARSHRVVYQLTLQEHHTTLGTL